MIYYYSPIAVEPTPWWGWLIIGGLLLMLLGIYAWIAYLLWKDYHR